MRTTNLHAAARTYSAYGAWMGRRQPSGTLPWTTHPPGSGLALPLWSNYLSSSWSKVKRIAPSPVKPQLCGEEGNEKDHVDSETRTREMCGWDAPYGRPVGSNHENDKGDNEMNTIRTSQHLRWATCSLVVVLVALLLVVAAGSVLAMPPDPIDPPPIEEPDDDYPVPDNGFDWAMRSRYGLYDNGPTAPGSSTFTGLKRTP